MHLSSSTLAFTTIEGPLQEDWGKTETEENQRKCCDTNKDAVKVSQTFQGRPKAPFDIIQKITFNCWNLAQFFCSSLDYCLV